MKLMQKLIIVIFLAFALLIFSWPYLFQPDLSDAQQETIDLFGNPSQFILTYLPQNSKEESNLVRYEIWYYPDIGQKITFLSGNLIDTQNFELESNLPLLSYLPWDFEFFNSYADLVDMFGQDNLHLIDLPTFNDEGLVTYSTEQYIFVLEDNYLTYIQTLDFDPDLEIPEEVVPDLTPTTTPVPDSKEKQSKNYSNSDIGFSIDYPDTWFLQSGVLTNYDTDYLFNGGTLPEKIIKCDFVNYNQDDFKLGDKEVIQDGDLTISQTSVEESEQDDSPGYGDNIVFLFEKDNHEAMALVCFAYNTDLEPQLLESIKTFKFL